MQSGFEPFALDASFTNWEAAMKTIFAVAVAAATLAGCAAYPAPGYYQPSGYYYGPGATYVVEEPVYIYGERRYWRNQPPPYPRSHEHFRSPAFSPPPPGMGFRDRDRDGIPDRFEHGRHGGDMHERPGHGRAGESMRGDPGHGHPHYGDRFGHDR
jgi:hypothetical protein